MTPRQRLLLAALALVPLLLMMSTSDPHRQRHHELALTKRGSLHREQQDRPSAGGISEASSLRSSGGRATAAGKTSVSRGDNAEEEDGVSESHQHYRKPRDVVIIDDEKKKKKSSLNRAGASAAELHEEDNNVKDVMGRPHHGSAAYGAMNTSRGVQEEHQGEAAASSSIGIRGNEASSGSQGNPSIGSGGGPSNPSGGPEGSRIDVTEGGLLLKQSQQKGGATAASSSSSSSGGSGDDAEGPVAAEGDLMIGPPEPLFYAAEGGVEARQLDAPEDPFSEDMRRWLPAAEALPGRLGRCAVVGNSATLRGAKHGPEVDSADAVIRVNQAPSGGGASADVGTRTTLRLLNMKWTEVYSSPSSRDWGRASVVHAGAAAKLVEADATGAAWLVSTRTRGSILARLSARREVAERYRRPSPLLLRKAFIGWVHNSLAAFSGSDAKAQPSTGLMAVFLAMRLCSDVQVFGFSGQVCRGAQHCSRAAHYWSGGGGGWIDADRLVTHPAHKFSLEGRLLCALAKAAPPRGISGLGNATLAVHWDGNGPPPGC